MSSLPGGEEHDTEGMIIAKHWDMTRSADPRTKQQGTTIGTLVRDISDANLKKIRTRLAANSLTDLRSLFLHVGPACKEEEKAATRQPAEAER